MTYRMCYLTYVLLSPVHTPSLLNPHPSNITNMKYVISIYIPVYSRLGEPSHVPGRVEGGGQPVLTFRAVTCFISSFPLLPAFEVGGLGFEF